jgi:hypothetical protein
VAWRLGGLAVGLAVAWVVERSADLGRGVMLAVPIATLGLLVGVLVGESRRCAAPDGARQAPLQVRRVADHLPRPLSGAVACGLVALAVLLVTGTLLGSPDDLGRAGRALAIDCGGGFSQRRGPWPGSFYAVPLAAVLVGGVLASWLAARAVVRRPLRLAPAGDHADVLLAERAARTRSVTDVVAALGVLVAVPLAGVAATTASGLHGIDCRPIAWTVLMVAALVTLGSSVVLLLACSGTLLRPPTSVGRERAPVAR